MLAEPQPLADNPVSVTVVFQRLGILAPSPVETEFDKKYASSLRAYLEIVVPNPARIQRKRFVFNRSITSSPRPLITALAM